MRPDHVDTVMNPDFGCVDFLWMAATEAARLLHAGAIEVWDGGNEECSSSTSVFLGIGEGIVRGNAHHQYRALSREISSSSAEIEQKSVSSVFLLSWDNVSSIVLGCHGDMHRQSWRNCRLKRYNFSRVMSASPLNWMRIG